MRKNPLSNMSAHGGIITSEFLETIRGDKVNNPRVEPQCFTTYDKKTPPADKRALDSQIDASFKVLLERWDAISLHYQKMSVSEARNKWMLPLFKELGFNPDFRREDIVVNGDDKLKYRLSHRGWSSESAPKIHMVPPSQDLEEASDSNEGEVVRRGRTRSPHDEMQAYLNVTKDQKWGIVTNGILLRILRDYFHTTTKGYVEFDLENIFRERSFTDFRAMYRMVHASRFLPDKDGISPLEQFYKESVAAGVKVGEDLRQNVKNAIEALGNGFLTPQLTKKLIEDEELCKAYYAELLRVIYRLLFLLFAEQRAMLPTKESLYIQEYSITRLRQMAEERQGKDDHRDLWEGLKVTFHMLKKGCPSLKVFGYNGSLFDDSEIPTLCGLSCKNEDVLEAVRNLTLIEEERVLKRINYLDLGVSEIGSIYESLLDYAPKVFASEQEIEGQKISANAFVLDPRGAARKTSGSYYTNPSLIDELIKSALKPVFEDRISKTTDKEKALLSIKLCDPACGSGAFLIAANNFLGKELAKLRTNEPEPSDQEIKKATRDVLQHCIYGVDLNPMATELAKVSLWINSCIEDRPLSFLDHHIKCGNSLVGTTKALLEKGIPDEAFTAVSDDNKVYANSIKALNQHENKQRLLTEYKIFYGADRTQEYSMLENLSELSPADVDEKKKKFEELEQQASFKLKKLCANTWASAFFWPLKDNYIRPPTQATLRTLAGQVTTIGNYEKVYNEIEVLSTQHSFFHWYLEFPDIFDGNKGIGFDCIIGNPPWERIKLQEKEFFDFLDPEISQALSKSKRKNLINDLQRENPRLYNKFQKAKRFSEMLSKFIRLSGRFALTAEGDLNTYGLFAELSRTLICPSGRVGLVLPTGIVTDSPSMKFFNSIVNDMSLVSFYGFKNEEFLFPRPVEHTVTFGLLTLVGSQHHSTQMEFTWLAYNIDHLNDKRRRVFITKEDLGLFNPLTRSCPSFRTNIDLELVRKIYRIAPFFIKGSANSWNVKLTTMFHMSNDSNLFLENECVDCLPLYEAKMLHQYDHRWASFEGQVARKITKEGKQNPDLFAKPRYWIKRTDFDNKAGKRDLSIYFAYRKVARATDIRTMIATVVCNKAMGESAWLIVPDRTQKIYPCLLANLNSMVLDYVCRQKLSGVNINFSFLKQLPILSPDAYSQSDKEFIIPRVLELVYTAWDIKPFAIDLNYSNTPFSWNENRRAMLQAEIDAYFAHLYGLSEEEFKYILDPSDVCGEDFPGETFRVLKQNEMSQLSKYRTKDLCLESYRKIKEKRL